MTGLEVWNAVKKYLNLYHHQAVKENIDVETVECMPINIIEKELKALEIIKDKNIDVYWLNTSPNLSRYNLAVGTNQALKKKEYELLKEVLL